MLHCTQVGSYGAALHPVLELRQVVTYIMMALQELDDPLSLLP